MKTITDLNIMQEGIKSLQDKNEELKQKEKERAEIEKERVRKEKAEQAIRDEFKALTARVVFIIGSMPQHCSYRYECSENSNPYTVLSCDGCSSKERFADRKHLASAQKIAREWLIKMYGKETAQKLVRSKFNKHIRFVVEKLIKTKGKCPYKFGNSNKQCELCIHLGRYDCAMGNKKPKTVYNETLQWFADTFGEKEAKEMLMEELI